MSAEWPEGGDGGPEEDAIALAALAVEKGEREAGESSLADSIDTVQSQSISRDEAEAATRSQRDQNIEDAINALSSITATDSELGDAVLVEKNRAEGVEGTKASKTELGAEATAREAAIAAAIAAVVDGAPGALDTLKELAAAAESDASGIASLTSSLAAKAAKTELVNEKERAETAENAKLSKTSNLSDLGSATTARSNLGLGTAATQASGAFDAAGAAAAAQAAAEGFATTKDGLLVPKSAIDTASLSESDEKLGSSKLVKSLLAGKAASSHTHAESDVTGLVADLARLNWSYRDHGLTACSVLEPATLTTSMTPEAGKPIYTRIPVLTGEPNFATIRLLIATAGTGATSLANCFLRVYTSAGVGLGGSADQATNWATTGEKGVTLTADAEKSLKVAGAIGTYVWVGLLVGTQSTTAVQLAVTANSSGRINFGMAAAGVPLRSATLGTAKTTLPTNITPAELTTSGVGAIGYGVV